MSNENTNKATEDAKIQKQNEDLPNIPASSEKINTEKTVKKEIHHTSKLQQEGNTDNTEKNSEN